MEGVRAEIEGLRQQVVQQQAQIQQQNQQNQQLQIQHQQLQQQLQQQQHQQQQQQQQQQQPQPQVAGNEVVTELRRIVGSLVTTQVVASITPFKGDAKQYKRWIKDVERQVAAINGDDGAKISAAIQTAQGVVADFLARYTTDNDDATWQQIKDELTNRFGDVVDASHALS